MRYILLAMFVLAGCEHMEQAVQDQMELDRLQFELRCDTGQPKHHYEATMCIAYLMAKNQRNGGEDGKTE